MQMPVTDSMFNKRIVLCLFLCQLFTYVAEGQASKGAPVFKITPVESKVEFRVKTSVSTIEGTFAKWDASLTFSSTDVSTGVLDVKIQTDSVNTGSGMMDRELKSEKFFNVKDDPYVTFRSTKITQTAPDTYQAQGTFTVRGVSKPETLTLTVEREGQATGEIKGTLAFDRKEFGITGNLPLLKIADRVEVTINVKATRVSGPPLLLKQ
jgi:polyisoprenoid-binding protein YceI